MYHGQRKKNLKKSHGFIMNKEIDIYKTWKTRNNKYCSDEQEMYIGYAKSKKLMIYDHYIEKYIIFDTLGAYWKMLDNTPKEYRCFEEVVFDNVPQSPVIEISLFSDAKYSGTKIVEILRTILDAMLVVFRTHYTDYVNIASVPTALDDFVVIDEIVQKDGKWHYFFHIQTTSFYFPCYSYCADFRERLCASLPQQFSSLISRPNDYIFQLVRISGSYLLSLDNYKRIMPYSQFLGTSTSVNRDDLFASRFSVMHDPAAYIPLRLRSVEQKSFTPLTLSTVNTITEEQCEVSEISKNVATSNDDRITRPHNRDASEEQTPSDSLSVSYAEHIQTDNKLGSCIVLDSYETITVDESNEQVDMSSVVLSQSSAIFITTETIKTIQPCENLEMMLTACVAINYMVVTLAICEKIGHYNSSNPVVHSKISCHMSTRRSLRSKVKRLQSKSNCTVCTAWHSRRKDGKYETKVHQRNRYNTEDILLIAQAQYYLISNTTRIRYPLTVSSTNKTLCNLPLRCLVVMKLWDNDYGAIPICIGLNIEPILWIRSRGCMKI